MSAFRSRRGGAIGLAIALAGSVAPSTAADIELEKRLDDPQRSYTAPDLAAGRDGTLCAAWLAHGDSGDQVLAARRRGGSWSEPRALSDAAGRYLTPRVAAERDGGCFAVWTALSPEAAGGADADPVGSAHLYGRRYDGPNAGPLERLTHAPGAHAAPALASDASGNLWLAWEAFTDGRFDIHARKRERGSWGALLRVTDDPPSDSQPSVAVDAAGRAHVAWMSRRDAALGGENTEIYVARLDAGGAAPTRVSVSDRLDALPTLVATPNALALVWTESHFASRGRHDLRALLYGEARDRGHRIAWLDNGEWSAPTESRPFRFVHERVSAVSAPDEGGLWLFYDRFGDRDGGSWISTLQRVTRTRRDAPTALDSSAISSGARIAAAADRGGAWLATVVEIPADDARRGSTDRGRARSALEIRRIETAHLPAREPARDAPPRKREPAAPGIASRPRPSATAGGEAFHAFFGDLHVHSSLSHDRMEYSASPDQTYRIVYDIAGLDFAGLSDHAEHFADSDWRAVAKYADLWNQPGRFVALPGYEWTSRVHGHKNVFFPDAVQADPGALFDSRRHTPDDLWEHLGARRALTIPHHVSSGPAGANPTDWRFRNDHFQRLVEIFQRRGSYEFDGAPYPPPARNFTPGHSVRAALDQGHRLGIIASPDHRGGLGLAGAWATALTRDAIFEALHARRTFGTSGARIDLWMTVNGAPQGSEISIAEDVHIEATVNGTLPGLELTLIANGHEVAKRHYEGASARFEWTDPQPSKETRYYYLRARQADGHLGWTSPVWVGDLRADPIRERPASSETPAPHSHGDPLRE